MRPAGVGIGRPPAVPLLSGGLLWTVCGRHQNGQAGDVGTVFQGE